MKATQECLCQYTDICSTESVWEILALIKAAGMTMWNVRGDYCNNETSENYHNSEDPLRSRGTDL